MEDTRDLREFIRYVALNVLGMLGLSCYILADTFFIARKLGSDGLAALNLALPVYSFIHGSGLLLGVGGATRFTILKHQGRLKEGQQVYTLVMSVAAVLAAVFVFTGLFLSDEIASLLGAQGTVHPMAKIYLQVLLLFSPLFLMQDLTLAFVRNDGAPHLVMWGMLASSMSNIVLDIVFIFWLDMGMFGAVFATSLVPAISLAVQLPFFLKKKNTFRLVTGRWTGKELRLVAVTGLPSLIGELSSGVVMIVFNIIVLSLGGNLAVAAYGVVCNLAIVVTAIYTGAAQGMQPLVSRCQGRGERARGIRFLKYGLGFVLGVSVLIYGVVFVFADPIAAAFNEAGDVLLQQMARQGLRIYFVSCFFAGINIVLAIYFACVERARSANLISVLRGFVLVIPMAFLLAWLGGLTGLWCAVAVTEALVAVLGWALWRAGKV